MNVYVIASDGGMCKIGKANDPDKRMSELKTGHPFRLSIAKAFPVESDARAYDVERCAHIILSAHRMTGEWFKVSPEDAIRAVESVINPAITPAEEWIDVTSWRIKPLAQLIDEIASMQRVLTSCLYQGSMAKSDVDAFVEECGKVASRMSGIMFSEDDDI